MLAARSTRSTMLYATQFVFCSVILSFNMCNILLCTLAVFSIFSTVYSIALGTVKSIKNNKILIFAYLNFSFSKNTKFSQSKKNRLYFSANEYY